MNVCLITGAPSAASFDPAVAEKLVGLGFRVVVLFLHPQARRLWNKGQLVYYAPSGAAEHLFGDPLEARYRATLDRARKRWLAPLEGRAGLVVRIAKGVERRAYKGARAAGALAAGRVESLAARLLSGRDDHDPLEKLPQGVGAFAVFQALDAESVGTAKRACTTGGAMYAGPELTEAAELQSFYEGAIMRWLRI